LRAIVYAAKSTEDTRGSIATQFEDGRAMAAREGWDVIAEYADEAASAWSGDRGPGLAAALDQAQRLAPCVLVVQHSDRLARGDGRTARHLGEIYFWALKAGVEIRSAQDDSTFTNPLLAFAMGERNAEDSRRKSLAVKAGMRRLAEAGKFHGGPRPFGLEPVDGRLRAVESEQAVIRRIDAEFLGGKTLTAISRGLHADGVRTAQGKIWRPSTVRAILESPLYAGRVRSKGAEFPADIDRCRSDRDHQRIQEMLANPATVRRGRLPNGNFLFRRGMLRCGQCGHGMTSRTDRRWDLEHYLCAGRMAQGVEFCDMPSIRRADVDSAVFRYFEQVGLDLEATRAAIAEARDRKLAEVQALRAAAELEAQRAEERLRRVRRDYADGKLDADDWRDFKMDLGAERNAAQAEARRLASQQADVERWGELADAEADTLQRLSEIRRLIAGEVRAADGLDGIRAALSRAFEHFVVHREAPRVHVELIAGPRLVIEPVVRERAIEGYSQNLRPILRREPLAATERDRSAMFGPIEVAAARWGARTIEGPRNDRNGVTRAAERSFPWLRPNAALSSERSEQRVSRACADGRHCLMRLGLLTVAWKTGMLVLAA
jgi:DNA invertase Pin-like site-specific DNA recombinase